MVGERQHNVQTFSDNEVAKQWFGEAYAGLTTDISLFEEELCYLRSLEEIGFSDDLYRALFQRSSALSNGVGELKSDVRTVLDHVSETWETFSELLEVDDASFFAPRESSTVTIGELCNRSERCANNKKALSSYHSMLLARSKVLATVGRVVVSVAEQNHLPFRELVRVFDFILYRRLADEVYREHPELQHFSGQELQNARGRLGDLDKRLLELEQRKIEQELFNRPIEPGIGAGRPSDYSERALIQHNVSLVRVRHQNKWDC